MTRVAILVSGSGTNLQALIDATAEPGHPVEIAVVVCNRPRAKAIARAQAAGIPVEIRSHRAFADRTAYDQELVRALTPYGVDWICCAGFMRILGKPLISAYPGRILNIHPSILPSFPGLNAQAQAIAAGVCVTGCTVHIVDAGVDTGSIIAQGVVPVHTGDTEDTLKARLLKMEHRVYTTVLRWAGDGTLQPGGVVAEGTPCSWSDV
ncbi:MAG: phosphoribosylglycinamide formyltransferase-1 [Myxococcota bacterium]|jgi:phosphoribosylglycinamide formyltransferase-1